MRAIALVGLLSLAGMSAFPGSAVAGEKVKQSWKKNTIEATGHTWGNDQRAAVRDARNTALEVAQELGVDLGAAVHAKTTGRNEVTVFFKMVPKQAGSTPSTSPKQ